MSHRPALTKLEFLVVGVIAVIAAGFLFMFIAHHRENSERVQCKNHLRVIGQAFQAYHDASSADQKLKRLPPSRIADGYATWAVFLAPHLSKDIPLIQWKLQESYFAQEADVRQARILFYFCPARRRTDFVSQAGDVDQADKLFPGGLGDYASVAGDGSADHDWTGPKANGALVIANVTSRKDDRILQWQSRTGYDSLTRGQAYTLLIGEKHVRADQFGDAAVGDGSLYNGQHPASFSRVAGPGFPLAPALDAPFNKNFGSSHNGVCNFLFADTSVQTMSTNISADVLGNLARRGE